MNCKLGGQVWSLQIPMKNCMVIGYDTYHDSITKGASYGAVISSTNQNWSNYFGQVRKHKDREELTNSFCAMIRRSLENYQKVNGVTPSSVIVFRDGVGEGQIEYVKDHEIAEIKKCFEVKKLLQKIFFGKICF